ncbi:hypothetical protein BDZ91DRAFT_796288 [Kalaharituber pfeilii]|nr:hypothetical protein BDZ91DRAFT_796288 [Kalaharituber pfeilii]
MSSRISVTTRSASPSAVRPTHQSPAEMDAANINPRYLLRSRSLSPSTADHCLPEAYATVGATQCGVVIGPTVSKTSLKSTSCQSSYTPTYISPPFISTKSRPSLYHRATDSSTTGSHLRGRSRSRSANTRPDSSSITSRPGTVLSSPSFAAAMIPPFAPFCGTSTCLNNGSSGALGYESLHIGGAGSNDSSRCSSRASSNGTGSVTTNATTSNVTTFKKGLVARFKSLVKGDNLSSSVEPPTVIYLTPEEAREREIKIKRAFQGYTIATGGLGL